MHKTKINSILIAIILVVFVVQGIPIRGSAFEDSNFRILLPLVMNKFEVDSWMMAGANPERTSRVTSEVRGRLQPKWYKIFEPFIPARFQLITADGLLFVSTARGLYALDAETGVEKWVYPTELPLGNSPTVVNGVAYVGGFDRQIHAIDTKTGRKLWGFMAQAGFDTNPLVVDGMVYAGSRDGVFYAIQAKGERAGQLVWRFPASGSLAGPIHTSAAYTNGTIYFAADDMYAYALKASDGSLIWRSTKLPGAGFNSWWPVVSQNLIIFSGSSSYRSNVPPFSISGLHYLQKQCLFPDGQAEHLGYIGEKISNDWIDATRASQCLEAHPSYRTYFVLDRLTGKEVIYDLDHDGKPEYAPILWFGTRAGNRYPPVVGEDGLLYQANSYQLTQYSFRGQVSGWKPGTSQISIPGAHTLANDEPIAYSAGGSIIYWNHCCDRSAGAFDVSIPNPGKVDPGREWVFFDHKNLSELIPGYNQMYYSSDIDATYGGINGVYGQHGDQNPPIPYRGNVYMHRSNAVIAFSSQNQPVIQLPTAKTQPGPTTTVSLDINQLRQQLVDEVLKIIKAGHLRPGYGIAGNFDQAGRNKCGNNLLDYWHDPSETIVTLIDALDYLPENMQQEVRTYIQEEFIRLPPYQFSTIGWSTGAPREAFNLPPEVEAERSQYPPNEWSAYDFEGWDFPPQSFYAMWKYAQEFGGAREIFLAGRSRLEPPPPNDLLMRMPFVLNAFIAGYSGYLDLEHLAGFSESVDVRSELNRLQGLRVQSFSKDSPYGREVCDPSTMREECYCKTLSVARNFMFLTPKLGQLLHDQIPDKVQAAVDEYNRVAPYWFVNEFEQTYGEGVFQPIYDSNAIFRARVMILQQQTGEVIKYLDVPVFAVGDLYYIQNLIAILDTLEN